LPTTRTHKIEREKSDKLVIHFETPSWSSAVIDVLCWFCGALGEWFIHKLLLVVFLTPLCKAH
jgi:membrane protein YqaA with SNARE-associated domain